MEIGAPLPIAEALETVPDGAQRWLAHPGGAAVASVTADRTQVGAVGPSGGFTEDERNRLLDRGFVLMSLSDGRLRTETATLAWAVRMLA
jgi:RsmE family RNA methyltransferase